MNASAFLKPKKFNIKAKAIRFTSTQFMTDLEKAKVYINFIKFLNNHFSQSTFQKNLYQHFHLHCGFIAHYNQHGFYGEYFETAAKFHYNVNGVNHKMHEGGGNLNCKSTLSQGELFYAIYEEMNSGGKYDGLHGFISTLLNNRNYGGYAEYCDLNDAIREAISDYKETWVGLIRNAIREYDKFNKNEEIQKLKAEQEAIKAQQADLLAQEREIESNLLTQAKETMAKEEQHVVVVEKKGQLSLFDFIVA